MQENSYISEIIMPKDHLKLAVIKKCNKKTKCVKYYITVAKFIKTTQAIIIHTKTAELSCEKMVRPSKILSEKV